MIGIHARPKNAAEPKIRAPRRQTTTKMKFHLGTSMTMVMKFKMMIISKITEMLINITGEDIIINNSQRIISCRGPGTTITITKIYSSNLITVTMIAMAIIILKGKEKMTMRTTLKSPSTTMKKRKRRMTQPRKKISNTKSMLNIRKALE